MGRFRIKMLFEDITWSTQYTLPKNSQYSDRSTDWTLVNLNFTVEKYGIKSNYQIDTPHADMCFSNITLTHSVIEMDCVNTNITKNSTQVYFSIIINIKWIIKIVSKIRSNQYQFIKKIVLINFLLQNDSDLLREVAFKKNDKTAD